MPTQEEVIFALTNFFENAKPDDDYNLRIARDDLIRIGDEMIFMGPAWIASNVMHFGKESLLLPPSEWDKTDDNIRRITRVFVSLYQSLVLTYNKISIPRGRASQILRTGLEKYSDEDCVAIAAYTLASDELTQKENMPYIVNAYKRCVGSSCKIILALAMKAHGDPGPWNRITKELVEQLIHNRIGEFTYELKGPQIAIEILAIDIASNGKEYSMRTDKWVRKVYD